MSQDITQPRAWIAVAVVLGLVAGGASTTRAQEAGGAMATRAQERPPVEYFASEVTAGLNLPFSEAVRAGDWVVLSGMIGVRPGTLELVPGGIEAEARQTFENIRLMLEAAEVDRTEIVKCTVMLDDIQQWSLFNEIYMEFFGDHRPARSALGADGLALGAAVELECQAFAPRR